MKLKLTIIAMTIALWLCPQGFAASQVIQKYVTIANDSGNTLVLSVEWRWDVIIGACDVTCTTVNYSFCADETPGCLEGFMQVPDSTFKGSVGGSYSASNSLTLNAEMMSGDDGTGEAYYCYAWDSDGNCTDQVGIPGTCAIDCPVVVGTIDLTFTKVPYSATLSNVIASGVNDVYSGGITSPAYNQYVVDQFADTVTGTAIGAAVTGNEGFMGFTQIVDTALPATTAVTTQSAVIQPVSTLMGGKVSDKVLRRLRALERAQKAYIAKRKGDDLTDKR